MTVNVKNILKTEKEGKTIPVYPVNPDIWARKNEAQNGLTSSLARMQNFEGKPGQILVVPDDKNGKPKAVYVGVASLDDMWSFSAASAQLPEGTYSIKQKDMKMTSDQAYKASVGWALAKYQFQIKNGALESDPTNQAQMLVPKIAQDRFKEIEAEIKATWKTRDLINMPANVLNTKELAEEVYKLGDEFNTVASYRSGPGFEKQFPLIHAVGKASENKPHIATITWSGSGADVDAPTILLVGKGVTFDSGGLQIKPGASMATMKKDMGGAANALGLARMIMSNDWKINLQVVIPIAENSVSDNAFRPGDVITARDGTEVEIGHTDAEGRLLLADALAYGVEKSDPDLIIDFATLTGAQRVADGTEVGGLFTNDKDAGRKMEDIGAEWNDDLQLHHLFEQYRGYIKSKNGGDITNSGSGGPGATTAAMFLQHFVRAARPETKWFHLDISGSAAGRPGRPAGGEAMGMRAAYRYLKAELKL